MCRDEAKQIIIDTGVAFRYSGIPSDEISFTFDDFISILEYVDQVSREATEFELSEIGEEK